MLRQREHLRRWHRAIWLLFLIPYFLVLVFCSCVSDLLFPVLIPNFVDSTKSWPEKLTKKGTLKTSWFWKFLACALAKSERMIQDIESNIIAEALATHRSDVLLTSQQWLLRVFFCYANYAMSQCYCYGTAVFMWPCIVCLCVWCVCVFFFFQLVLIASTSAFIVFKPEAWKQCLDGCVLWLYLFFDILLQ